MFVFGVQPEHSVKGFRYVVEQDTDPDDGTTKLWHFAEHQYDTGVGMRRYLLKGRSFKFLDFDDFRKQVICLNNRSV